MELHHPLLQLARLIGSKAEIADVVGAVVILVVVSQLGLNSVGAQEGVSDERARQATWQHVIPQLQTQVVSVRWDEKGEERKECWQSNKPEPMQAPTSIQPS